SNVADRLQLFGDLTRQHLDEARPEHAERRPRVRDVLQLRRLSYFIHLTARRRRVAAIEGCEIEALPEHEDVRDDIAAAAGDSERQVVTTGAGIGVRRRDAIEIAGEQERARRIPERIASAFGQRTAAAVLDRPSRREQRAAVFDERFCGERELLTVL